MSPVVNARVEKFAHFNTWVTGSVMRAVANGGSLKFGVQGASATNWFPRVNGVRDNGNRLYLDGIQKLNTYSKNLHGHLNRQANDECTLENESKGRSIGSLKHIDDSAQDCCIFIMLAMEIPWFHLKPLIHQHDNGVNASRKLYKHSLYQPQSMVQHGHIFVFNQTKIF